MQFPLTVNEINPDTYGFQVLVYKVIKLLNTKNDPLYLSAQARNNEMPINGFRVTDGIGESTRAVFEFANDTIANRILIFLSSALSGEEKTLLQKLDMHSHGQQNWARKISLKTESSEIVKKEEAQTLQQEPVKPVTQPQGVVTPAIITTATPTIITTATPVIIERATKETFLKIIRDLLVTILPIEELEKQRVLKKYTSPDSAEILIPDPTQMSKALYILEKQGFAVTMLGSTLITSKNVGLIELIPHHQTIQKELAKCRQWFIQVQAWLEEEHIHAEIISHPLQIVRSNYEQKVAIRAESSFGAQSVEKFFNLNGIAVNKMVHMVHVQLNQMLVNKPLMRIKIERNGFDTKEENTDVIVHKSWNYGEFHLLPFNRDIDNDHVNWIATSLDEFGTIDFIKVVYTDCVDGEFKLWIIDGQHTYTAEKKRKLPILYVLIKVDSLEELVRLTAVLNNRRKLWKPKDYLKAWSQINVPVYKKILNWIGKKLPFGIVLEALSGKNRREAAIDFKDGNFEESALISGDDLLANLTKLKPELPVSQALLSSMLRFMWTEKDYDNERMMKALGLNKPKVVFETGETDQSRVAKIRLLYESIAAAA